MNIYIPMILEVISLHAIVTILGSILGAMINADTKRYGIRLVVLMTLFTCSTAGAVAEHLATRFSGTSLFLYFVLGGFIGIFGLSLLDALRLASADFTHKLVEVLSKTLLEGVADTVAAFFRMVQGWIERFQGKK